jgi:hypothetical protein
VNINQKQLNEIVDRAVEKRLNPAAREAAELAALVEHDADAPVGFHAAAEQGKVDAHAKRLRQVQEAVSSLPTGRLRAGAVSAELSRRYGIARDLVTAEMNRELASR